MLQLLLRKRTAHYIENVGRNALPVEAGGMLVGEWLSKTKVFVKWVSEPGPNATQSSHFYIPDYEYDKRWFDSQFAEFGVERNYLGDWHTHPYTRRPYLSWRDRSALKTICKATNVNSRPGISIVAAVGDESFALRAWYGLYLQLPLGVRVFRTLQFRIVEVE